MPVVRAEPYAWPYDGHLAPRTTALVVIDIRRSRLTGALDADVGNPDARPARQSTLRVLTVEVR